MVPHRRRSEVRNALVSVLQNFRKHIAGVLDLDDHVLCVSQPPESP